MQNVFRSTNLTSGQKLKNPGSFSSLSAAEKKKLFQANIIPSVALNKKRGAMRAAEAELQVRGRGFVSCSHGYHHLLGSEVTGNFCRHCMRFARRNSPLSAVLLLPLAAPLGPCAHTHFFCQVTSCYSVSPSFEQDYWDYHDCSCTSRHLQFRFD